MQIFRISEYPHPPLQSVFNFDPIIPQQIEKEIGHSHVISSMYTYSMGFTLQNSGMLSYAENCRSISLLSTSNRILEKLSYVDQQLTQHSAHRYCTIVTRLQSLLREGTCGDRLRYTTSPFMSTVPVLVHCTNHFRVNSRELLIDTTE